MGKGAMTKKDDDDGGDDDRRRADQVEDEEERRRLELLASMGFDRETCRQALDYDRRGYSDGGNVTFTDSVEWILSSKKKISVEDDGTAVEVKRAIKIKESSKGTKASPEVADPLTAKDGRSGYVARLGSSTPSASTDDTTKGLKTACGETVTPRPELVPPSLPLGGRDVGMELFQRGGSCHGAGAVLLSPAPEMVSPSAPPLGRNTGMEPPLRSGRGMPLSSFPIPADATPGLVPASLGSNGSNEASLAAHRHDSVLNPAPPRGQEDGEEQTAYSAYIAPERRRREEGGGALAAASGAVSGPSADEPVYNGVPVPSSASEPKGDTNAMNCRFRKKILGVATIIALLALTAVSTTVVLTHRRKTESNSQKSADGPIIPIVDRVPLTLDPTMMPSSKVSSERYVVLRSVLTSALTSRGMSVHSLDDPSSPQGLALHWLAYEDKHDASEPRIKEEGQGEDELSELSIVQRFALVTFYFSTGGPDAWVDKHNFLSPKHECDWNVPGTEDSSYQGNYFEVVGAVCWGNSTSIDEVLISNNNITGVIPDEIGLLDSLVEFRIMKNDRLGGPVPEVLLNLPNLQVLILNENSLSGPIPNYNGTSSPLLFLSLAVNNLNSTIPSSLGQLSQLTQLWLGHNHLTGSIPSELGQLSQLVYLVLTANELTASFDLHPGALPSLVWLSKSYNFITHVPSQLFGLRNLTLLHLNENSISGTIHSDIGYLIRLEELGLAVNLFEGTLPPALWEMTALHLAYFAINRFNGTLSTGIGHLTELKSLALGGNELSGMLPKSIGQLTNLKNLEVSLNKFTGQVPNDSLVRLRSLEVLGLHNNSFTGNLSSVCNLNLTLSTADCLSRSNNIGPEVTCECCTACCLDADDSGPIYGCFRNS